MRIFLLLLVGCSGPIVETPSLEDSYGTVAEYKAFRKKHGLSYGPKEVSVPYGLEEQQETLLLRRSPERRPVAD